MSSEASQPASSEASLEPSRLSTEASSNRVVHTADAIGWLRARESIPGASFVASLPDFSEFPTLSLEEWKEWFVEAARLILTRTPDDGVALFFQSDIKREGVWIDKGYLVARAAERSGHSLLFHKIFCRAAPGATTHGKPAYSHLLAFSKSVRTDSARSTPDVVPEVGDKAWVRGMGFQAARVACEFIRRETATRTVVNPFSGYGSVLAVAESLGLAAVGIERSPKRAERARSIRVAPNGREFELGFGRSDDRDR